MKLGRAAWVPERAFRHRVLIVDDEVSLRLLGKSILESQGYEVHCAEDGFEGLAALRNALPDMIISDLQMPNMNGFEFLSVVRQRFPTVPVIVISGEFSGVSVPESVLADAFFAKGSYNPAALFEKISDLLTELPTRPAANWPKKAAVWAKNGRELLAVTCSECLRTFPVAQAGKGLNEADCDFCASKVQFEIVSEQAVA
ncbi:CheY-like chemotaxis protein [Granulicella aggregans]|uniref:CheY-like chemotaxis protein n=1 Tax=Granulicella aggregans TaxID=474949 RepID=A0A7W7ZHA7_9BACT|nr:response regulator [Granulicella aggregans]MBB5059934.1 CheY-like chemotaxis protein [Granulicella aggregans]